MNRRRKHELAEEHVQSPDQEADGRGKKECGVYFPDHQRIPSVSSDHFQTNRGADACKLISVMQMNRKKWLC